MTSRRRSEPSVSNPTAATDAAKDSGRARDRWAALRRLKPWLTRQHWLDEAS
jgi:hypothetical protein